MPEASLAFPAICLTFSFLFIVAVHNASIIQNLGAFHYRILLPVYQQIQRMLTNRDPITPNPPNHMPEARYELINLNPNNEEEQPSPRLATSFMPPPDHHRYGETPAPDTVNLPPEIDNETRIDNLNMTARYAGGPYRPQHRPTYADIAEFSTYSPLPSPPGDGVSSDEYDSDWSNSAVDEAIFESRILGDDIPVWEFEVERPIYILDQRDQGGWRLGWMKLLSGLRRVFLLLLPPRWSDNESEKHETLGEIGGHSWAWQNV
ncbi:hypothetical protein N7447_002783 [Penicillium robsamsonii]|uniref:uncharacterized protein n=1 Tax=Penicillium robsamsonii TaxID=1792511 RepID=UPI002548DB6E|nr:uncharacterized protein N7447_002783 [Penicillium robsamsonii]KAJ5836757.1 hypothetical protein N7447_002783 [Penicillium robsamsonii]